MHVSSKVHLFEQVRKAKVIAASEQVQTLLFAIGWPPAILQQSPALPGRLQGPFGRCLRSLSRVARKRTQSCPLSPALGRMNPASSAIVSRVNPASSSGTSQRRPKGRLCSLNNRICGSANPLQQIHRRICCGHASDIKSDAVQVLSCAEVIRQPSKAGLPCSNRPLQGLQLSPEQSSGSEVLAEVQPEAELLLFIFRLLCTLVLFPYSGLRLHGA